MASPDGDKGGDPKAAARPQSQAQAQAQSQAQAQDPRATTPATARGDGAGRTQAQPPSQAQPQSQPQAGARRTRAAAGEPPAALNDRQKAEAVRRRFPDRPEVTADVEAGATIVVYRDNQGREIAVDRYSPGVLGPLADDPDDGGDGEVAVDGDDIGK